MSTPNYALALALSAAGWSNGETARRINAHARLRGHRGIAIDAARVGRWIRNGEKPRPPIPGLISELLIQEVGEPATAQDLCLTKSCAIRVTIEEPDYAILLLRAEASNLAPDTYVRNLVLADIATQENGPSISTTD
ncbi:hypothetical protein [Streptomyces sp. NPDC048172]|uniref:hypothetical protein n=1 Tax=Streptomyces sp. NPDC048172 TaxID=3365505 RepID=UPI003713EF48